MTGVRKARKFEIGENGNSDYEELINSPFITVIKEDCFNNFTNHFIIVHYIDMMDGIPDGWDSEEEGESNGSDEQGGS